MYEHRSRRCQAGVLLLLFGVGFCLCLFPLTALQLLAPDPSLPAVARASVVVQDVCLFILPPALGALLLFEAPAREVLSLGRPRVAALVCAVAVMGLLNPLIDLTGQWNTALELPARLQGLELWMRQMEDSASLTVEGMLHDGRVSILLLNILVIAVLAGVSEELLFRGLLLKLFYRWLSKKGLGEKEKSAAAFPQNRQHFHAAVWLTALLFSAIHLQFYGFLPRLLLGAALGYICAYGGLWAAILAHSANNALAILAYPGQPYNEGWQWVSALNETGSGEVSLPVVIVCSALAVGLLRLMQRAHNKGLRQ